MQQAASDISTANLPSLSGQLLPKAVLRVLANSQAGLAWQHYGYLDWIAQQSCPFTATAGEYLVAWAALKGVLRIAATPASGPVNCTGISGAVIPGGTIMQRLDNVQYTTDSDIQIGSDGTGTGTVTASDDGALGNTASGTVLNLTTSIVGVNSSATTGDLIGGADEETDSSLKTRMLQAYASPSQGGSTADFERWAREVPGVTRAWASSTGGSGQVTVYTMWDAVNAAIGGFPIGSDGVSQNDDRYTTASGQQLIVADYLYGLRPVTTLAFSVAPKPYPIDIVIQSLVPNTLAVQASIRASLISKLTSIGTPLGGTVYQSDISGAVENVSAVQSFVLVSMVPHGTTPGVAPQQVAIPVGYLPTLGTLTVA